MLLSKKGAVRNNRSINLGERTRTSDLLHPMQARYQAALHPDRSLDTLQAFKLKFCIFELFYADASALFDDLF